jgi:hypothetical protein
MGGYVGVRDLAERQSRLGCILGADRTALVDRADALPDRLAGRTSGVPGFSKRYIVHCPQTHEVCLTMQLEAVEP